MRYPSATDTNMSATAKTGTQLTANASAHTEAAGWTILIASTSAAVEGFWARVCEVSASATDTGALLDFAYGDPTTGGNEVEIVTDWNVGEAAIASVGSLGKVQFHPQAIPANKSLSARFRAAVTSETADVAVVLITDSEDLESVTAGVTFGANTAASRGTSVTPGNSAFGSWTEIGTLAADLSIFYPALDSLGDTTITANGSAQVMEIGHGPNSGAVTSIGVFAFALSTSEAIAGPFPPLPHYKAVSSGDKLWARIASGNDTEARGVTIHAAAGTTVSGGGGNTFPVVGDGGLVF